jgi:hypothetical protein
MPIGEQIALSQSAGQAVTQEIMSQGASWSKQRSDAIS